MESTGWGGLRRFGAYALVTLIPVVWLGFVLTHTFRTEIQRDELHEAASHATTIAQAAVEPHLRGQPLSVGLTGEERRALALTTGNLLREGTVLQLRLRTNDGQVVFDAADPEAAPGTPTIDAEVQEAVELGSLVMVTTVGADVVDGQRTDGLRAIEAYVVVHPMDRPDLTVGVAEMYLPYAPIADGHQSTINRLIFTIFVGLAILWLVLVALAGTASRPSASPCTTPSPGCRGGPSTPTGWRPPSRPPAEWAPTSPSW